MSNEPIEAETVSLSVVPKENPGTMMRHASDAAGVCREIVIRTACQIQGRKYVKCEGWMAIATAHGCIASSRDVRKVDGGWTAIGEIRRINDGALLAQAEGFVGLDEKKWGNCPEYASRAMAQTRAISRACRAAFAHVVVMMDAGLSTTPAEEVPEGGFDEAPPMRPATTPAPRPAPQTPPAHPAAPAATPAAKKETPEEKLARFVAQCRVAAAGDETIITGLLSEMGWLMEGETIDDIGITRIPRTKAEADNIINEIRARSGAGDEVPGMAPEAQLPEGAEEIRGFLKMVMKKPAGNKGGFRYSLLIVKNLNADKDPSDVWCATFSDTDGALAESLKGQPIKVHCTTGKYGKDLVHGAIFAN